MKTLWIIAIVVLVLFIGIQFIPKNMPENPAIGGTDLMASMEIPEQVAEILRNSCYDCHSFETQYPWYSHVAPSAWLLARDIREGREHLNFSSWGDYSLRNQIGKLDGIQREVESGDMPLQAYTVIHRKAKLDEDQIAAVVNWTEEALKKVLE